jgi:YihY family inner membrane protein
MDVTTRLDRFQRRHRWAAFPLAVAYKYFDDYGGYLAALIAYYAFVSLFPLLLLLSTVLGFFLANDPHLQREVLDSALGQFPVVGDQLSDPRHIGGGPVGLAIGIAGSVYGGLGAAQAMQYAMNTVWSVPRNERPNPLQARGRSLLMVATGGVGLLATTALSALAGAGVGSFGMLLRAGVLLLSLVLNSAAFVLMFRIATGRDLAVRDVARGAVAAAVVWQLLQSFGVVYVGHVVQHASATNGVFAIVLGLIAFLYVTAAVVVFCAEVNVVHVEGLHPRALMAPFTDDVSLTRGDRRAYATQAEAQQMKGFEDVDVSFDQPPAPGEDET